MNSTALGIPTGAIEARDSDLSLNQTISDVMVNYIKHINIYYTKAGLKEGIVSGDVDVTLRPLPVEATVDKASGLATRDGIAYLSAADIIFPTPGVVIPPLGTRNTGRIKNVKVEHDLTALMQSGLVDVNLIVIMARAPTFYGVGGIPVNFTGKQNNIPIKFTEEFD